MSVEGRGHRRVRGSRGRLLEQLRARLTHLHGLLVLVGDVEQLHQVCLRVAAVVDRERRVRAGDQPLEPGDALLPQLGALRIALG